MPGTCQHSDSWTCAAVYDWTGNETLAHGATWLIGKPLAILVIIVGADRGPLARLQGDRPRRTTRRDRSPARARQHAFNRRAQRAKSLGSLLKSVTTTVVFGIAFVMVLSELGLNVAPDPGQRRCPRPGDRLRRPEPRQGLPVRRDDDDRGPVRRGRRGRPRRGDRHGRARRPCASPASATSTAPSGTSATARSCASATPARTGPARCSTSTSATTEDLRKVREVLQEVAHGLWDDEDYRDVILEEPEVWGVQAPRPRLGHGARHAQDRPAEAVGRGPRDARADQGALRPRGHRDAGPPAPLLAAAARAQQPTRSRRRRLSRSTQHELSREPDAAGRSARRDDRST